MKVYCMREICLVTYSGRDICDITVINYEVSCVKQGDSYTEMERF